MADSDFHNIWGTEGAGPSPQVADDTGTRVLDPKAFEQQWLTSNEKPKQDTGTLTSTVNAATGNAINAIPIVGPYIKSGTEKIAARIRSKIYGTSPEDELANIRDYGKQSEEAHSTAATIGTVGGAVGPMLVGAGVAPRALGLAGSLAERVGYGAGSNALINAADTAVRTDANPAETAKSAGVGALFGGGLPLAGRGLGMAGNALFGSGDAATNALAARAEAMGIPIYASQTTGSPFLAKASQMAGRLPGSGMGNLIHEQQTGLNSAVARTIGEDADRITPDVMATARARIGGVMNDVAANTTIQADTALHTDLHRIITQAERGGLSDPEINQLHRNVNNVLDSITGSGQITGRAYQELTHHNAPLDLAAGNRNSNIGYYAGQIRNALDSALERSAPPEEVGRLRNARREYKSMKTIEDLVEKSPTGDISAPLLMGAVRGSYGNMAYGGGGDLADLARIGQRFMRQPSDSGTPLGEAALKLLIGGGAALSGAGLAGYNSGYDPIEMLKGAALLPATALAARGATTLLNRPQAVNALMQRGTALVPTYNQLTAEQR